MIRTTDILTRISEEQYRNRRETELLSVIINGIFKTVVFVKIEDKCYIAIGETSAYDAACYWKSALRTGLLLINTKTADWYEVTKDEGNAIYAKIRNTAKIAKNGHPYYKWVF